MNTTLFLSSASFVIGALLLVAQMLAGRREPLAVRLARVEGRLGEIGARGATLQEIFVAHAGRKQPSLSED